MAIYHLAAKIISRGKGQSAIAAAAYRSGERLKDEQTGELKHYHARSDRILFTDILAPADAPEWAHDRNALWNNAERAEKRKDAQLAREIEIALPHELTDQQREWLVKDFAREAYVRAGYVVDIAIHAPDREADIRNYHAHLMVTRRQIGPKGFSPTKDWRFDPRLLEHWREQWESLANRHLERHGHDARIDRRSFEARGIDLEPSVHIGYAAMEITLRGGVSYRMDEHVGAESRNEERKELYAERAAIDRELQGIENDHALREKRDRAETMRRQAQALGGAARPAEVAGQVGVPAQPQNSLKPPELEADERLKPPTSASAFEWTDRADLVSQQRAATDMFNKLNRDSSPRKAEAESESKAKKPRARRPIILKVETIGEDKSLTTVFDHTKDNGRKR